MDFESGDELQVQTEKSKGVPIVVDHDPLIHFGRTNWAGSKSTINGDEDLTAAAVCIKFVVPM